MRGTLMVVGVGAALSFVVIAAGQDVRPVPGPGTGIVTVTGTVEIGNEPSVSAVQAGEWKVSLANMPEVRVAAHAFLKAGRRYRVVWTSGESEDVVLAQLGSGGWARVDARGGRPRWLNLDRAASLDELDGSGR